MLFCCTCGRKIDVRPPYAVRPRPPSNVRVILKPWGAELIFKIPHRRVDGYVLEHLKGFQILRFGKKISGVEKTTQRTYFLRFKENGSEIRFQDRALSPGFRYQYEIRAISGWHCISEPVRSAPFAWHTPPCAPKDVIAKAGDNSVYLRWKDVKFFLDNTPIPLGKIKYRIFKIEKDNIKPIPNLIEKDFYLDQKVQNGHLYCYRIAAVFEYFGSLIQGPLSKERCARPIDLIPPRPPEGLIAIRLKGGVLLRWHWNTELDIAGYRVYRYRPGSAPQLLNKDLLKRPKFFDKDISIPGLYYYWVTAVDNSPRANESPPSKKVEVEILPEEE